jgi:hypothetical protein
VKPLFSDEEKVQFVRNFLIACKNNEAKIQSYKEVANYLNADRIKMLCKVPKTGHTEPSYGNVWRHVDSYENVDGKTYFEWLVGVVSGTEHESVTEETIKKANDQLFHFIQIMENADDIRMDKNVQLMAPYDWQKLFLSFDKELIEIKNTVERHDKEIVDVLKSISELMKKNINLLKTLQDTLQEEHKYFPQGESP